MVGNAIGLRRWAKALFGPAREPAPVRAPAPPTVFHVTHYKAGSQWIHRLFQALVPDRIVAPDVDPRRFLDRPVVAGKVYPTLYLTREQFQSVPRPADSCAFVMIRDLRDTLVSLYFSHLKSHEITAAWMQAQRASLASTSREEGLLMCLDKLVLNAQIQWSWIKAGVPVLKYEELLRNDEEILAEVLLRQCRLGIDPGRFREVVRANRFEAFSGRKPGEEDVNSHQRKGIAGDWRNHFTPRVTAEFKERYGSLLIATGYEKDFNW